MGFAVGKVIFWQEGVEEARSICLLVVFVRNLSFSFEGDQELRFLISSW